MAAISPFNFLAVLDGKAQAPEQISQDLTIPAFEDALASMLGAQAASANDGGPQGVAAKPTLGLSTGPRVVIDPPLIGVPSGDDATVENAENDADFGVFSAEITTREASRDTLADDAEEASSADDEAQLVNPQACFVTLPWLPPSERAPEPPTSIPTTSIPTTSIPTTSTAASATPTVDVAAGRHEPELSAHAALERAALHAHNGARGDGPRRHGTLRFPPPPAESIEHVMREVAPVKTETSKRPEEAAPIHEKTLGEAPQTRRAQGEHAAPEARFTPRVLDPGFVVAPSFVEGGRVEWTLSAPATPANDTHRSMSYAVAAAENEQRTLRSEPRAARRERISAVSAAQPALREASDRTEPVRAITASAEVAKATDAVTTIPAPEAPSFMGHAQPARNEAPVEPRVLANAAQQPDLRREASRERRQDDAELTVSQMTLSHRVEARTVVEDLGSITVRAETKHGQVDVSVAADRVDTAAFLDQNRADLTRDLKLSSPNVSDVSVSRDMRGGDSGQSSHREQPPQRRTNDEWAAGTPSSMAASVADTRTISANGKRVRIVL